jgi:hypothetical protein
MMSDEQKLDLQIRITALQEALKVTDDPTEIVPLAAHFFKFLKGELK